MDPDDPKVLMNYDLDQFNNSIWENFLGSQIQISKIVEQDGSKKTVSQNIQNMGIIQLQVKDEKLYESWELGRKNLTKDYAGLKEG